MDAHFIETLVRRRDELHNELIHIEELIKIYQGDNVVIKSDSVVKPRLVRTKFNSSISTSTVKSQILAIIKELGEEFYVADLVSALESREPKKDHQLISNMARNYIYILKKEGVISGQLADNNKYKYKMNSK